MSELIVLGLKLGFLALLWIFILLIGNVIRTDLFGHKVSSAELVTANGKQRRRNTNRIPQSLKVTHGTQAGQVLTLGTGLLIGRSSECQLILDDDYVSTSHARIVPQAGGYMVEDLGSTNGTFINNKRITTPITYNVGDTLRIGRTLMVAEK